MKDIQARQPSIQDFRLIKTHVEKYMKDLDFTDESLAFNYFSLDHILNLQEDEIDDAITDTFYLRFKKKESGHDRGIDAIYIDSSTIPDTVHIFSFKYAMAFEKSKGSFPSNEIDKIYSFLASLFEQDKGIKLHINKFLYSKVKEIWNLFNSQNPIFVIHLCCNYFEGLEHSEKKRFEKLMKQFSNITCEYHLINWFVDHLTHKGRKEVNGQVKAIDKNLFEKSDGDIRALIVNIDARDLLRLVIDNEELRNSVDPEDYSKLKKNSIMEEAFDDNVRIYLKQRSKINRNIKETALSKDSHRFFYFNNGITIICDQFKYPKGQRSPIIEIKNLQIVNGSQTIHALFEAFIEDHSKFEDIDILCRIYQTSNFELTKSIAEYTNSQNPVKTRDLRANDFIQKKIEAELNAYGYFYERKKNQHNNQAKDKRIDAEKTGQVLMSFFNKMPAEAKDRKRLIFADLYEVIFNDSISADKVLLAFKLFERIERIKKETKNFCIENPDEYEKKSFVIHSPYYFLYALSELASLQEIPQEFNHMEKIWGLYKKAYNCIEEAVKMEQEELKDSKDVYEHRTFFKSDRPKKHLERSINEAQG